MAGPVRCKTPFIHGIEAEKTSVGLTAAVMQLARHSGNAGGLPNVERLHLFTKK